MNYLNVTIVICECFIEIAKRSAKNDCLGPTKSSKFDFNITDDDFEDFQAGYQLKTTIHNTEWSIKVFNSWVEDKTSLFLRKFQQTFFGHFVTETQWQDGNHYAPKTLQFLLFG